MLTNFSCIKLANLLIDNLKLNSSLEKVKTIIEIDGKFLWTIIKNVFKTNLLPEWKKLDCVNEIEEFQFIICTLEQIFDISLGDISAAYMKRRNPKYIFLVLNSIFLAHEYIEYKKDNQFISEMKNELTIKNFKLNKEVHDLDLKEYIELSSLSSIEIFDENISEKETKDFVSMNSEKDKFEKKDKTKNNLEILYNSNEIERKKNEDNKEVNYKIPNLINKEVNLENKNELLENYKLIKQQNLSLQVSFKILDILQIQKKSEQIEKNLNKLKSISKNSLPRNQSKKLKKTNSKNHHVNHFSKTICNSKKTKKNNPKIENKFNNKIDLNTIINNLAGLSIGQLKLIENQKQQQNQLMNKVNFEINETEKRLQNQIVDKIDKENKFLNILQKDLNLFHKIPSMNEKTKNIKENSRIEEIKLKKQVDKYHLVNLSKYKNLKSKHEMILHTILKKEDETFRKNLIELKRESKEIIRKKQEEEKLILDNYDNFFSSQINLIQEEILKQKNKYKNDSPVLMQSITKHLEQCFISNLKPRLN